MKKSYLSTAFSLLLFLSSANSGVLARSNGRSMSTDEIVPFCRKIRCLFEKKYEPVLSKVANPENVKPIPLKEPIKKLVDDMSDMAKNAETVLCTTFASYILRLLEKDQVTSGLLLLDALDNSKDGHSVVVYKREVEIQGEKVEKWFVCDLSMAFLFWHGTKVTNDKCKSKKEVMKRSDLNDPRDVLNSMEDFLSIPLLYYFNDMGASKIYYTPQVLDCDHDDFRITGLNNFLKFNSKKNSDYDKKILSFFDEMHVKYTEKAMCEEARKMGMSMEDFINQLTSEFLKSGK